MRYAVALLTHGQAPHLPEALMSFDRWVAPKPTARLAVVDGPDSVLPPIHAGQWHIRQTGEREGFCRASALLWEHAREQAAALRLDAVLWLENDFRWIRPVDLSLVWAVLQRNPRMAQMAFMRQPVNAHEQARGSVDLGGPTRYPQHVEHDRFWTTNPALIPGDVMQAYDWPTEPRCEGLFGVRMRARGHSFGYWGQGEGDVWVEHMGTRDGTGKGY